MTDGWAWGDDDEPASTPAPSSATSWTGAASTGPSTPPPVWGEGPVPIRPLRFGELLDAAFRILRREARVLVALTALFVVPINLVTGFLTRDLFDGLSLGDVVNDPTTADTVADTPGAGELLATLVTLVTSAVVLPVVAGAAVAVVADSYLGRETSVARALEVVRRRGWALVGAWLLVHLVEVLLFALPAGVVFAVLVASGSPGLVAAVSFLAVVTVVSLPLVAVAFARFTAVSPALVEEGLGPVAAARRSWRLVRGRTWPVLLVSGVAGLIASVLGGILSTPAEILGLVIGTARYGWLVVAVGGIIGQLVTTPFTAIVATLVYFDQRVRQEAFDLELLADEIAAREDPAR